MLIVFIVLIVGPVIVRKYINNLPSIPMELLQPTGQNNNDTTTGVTGSALVNFGQDAGTAAAGAATATGTGAAAKTSDPFAVFGGGGGSRLARW